MTDLFRIILHFEVWLFFFSLKFHKLLIMQYTRLFFHFNIISSHVSSSGLCSETSWFYVYKITIFLRQYSYLLRGKWKLLNDLVLLSKTFALSGANRPFSIKVQSLETSISSGVNQLQSGIKLRCAWTMHLGLY